MVAGAGRRIGAWIMLAGAIALVVAILVASAGADAVDAQMRALDPSQSRVEQTFETLASGAAIAALAIFVFIVGAIAFAVGTTRGQKRGTHVAQPSGAIASVSAIAIAIAILLAVLSPHGPVQRLTAAATQTGDSVRIESHFGNLTGLAGAPNAPEDVWPYHPPSARGAILMKFGSGADPRAGIYGVGTAVAIVEAQQRDGSWKEVLRARGNAQNATLAETDFPGDLRVRTQLEPGSAGTVMFGFVWSYAPARS